MTKKRDRFARLGEKEVWVSVSLQQLKIAKFTDVVDKLLSGEYMLIKPLGEPADSEIERIEKNLRGKRPPADH